MSKFFVLCSTFIFYSCSVVSDGVQVQRVSVEAETSFAGLGIESKDIDVISKNIVADLLVSDFYKNAKTVLIVVLEGAYFKNESSYIINTNLLADRMRISLLRQTKGAIQFVTRQNLQAIIDEAKTSGSDIDITEAGYRMTARITSIHKISNETGIKSNYFQFSFELLNLQKGSILWANIYDIKKLGADDTIYR